MRHTSSSTETKNDFSSAVFSLKYVSRALYHDRNPPSRMHPPASATSVSPPRTSMRESAAESMPERDASSQPASRSGLTQMRASHPSRALNVPRIITGSCSSMSRRTYGSERLSARSCVNALLASSSSFRDSVSLMLMSLQPPVILRTYQPSGPRTGAEFRPARSVSATAARAGFERLSLKIVVSVERSSVFTPSRSCREKSVSNGTPPFSADLSDELPSGPGANSHRRE